MNYRIQFLTDEYAIYRTVYHVINEIDRLSKSSKGYLSSGGQYTPDEQRILEDDIAKLRGIISICEKDIQTAVRLCNTCDVDLTEADLAELQYLKSAYPTNDKTAKK